MFTQNSFFVKNKPIFYRNFGKKLYYIFTDNVKKIYLAL